MRRLARYSIVALVTAFAAAATAQAADLQLPQCHKVNSQVGLIVREAPSSDASKVGTLKYGEKVLLSGKPVEGDPLIHSKTTKVGNATWIKIKKPVHGFVLYSVDDDPAYRYLVPCKD